MCLHPPMAALPKSLAAFVMSDPSSLTPRTMKVMASRSLSRASRTCVIVTTHTHTHTDARKTHTVILCLHVGMQAHVPGSRLGARACMCAQFLHPCSPAFPCSLASGMCVCVCVCARAVPTYLQSCLGECEPLSTEHNLVWHTHPLSHVRNFVCQQFEQCLN